LKEKDTVITTSGWEEWDAITDQSVFVCLSVCLSVCLFGTATDLILSLRDRHEHVFFLLLQILFVIMISLFGCALTDLHTFDRKHMKGYIETHMHFWNATGSDQVLT
jgi:predicted tellurium resistance membrane protein TerC